MALKHRKYVYVKRSDGYYVKVRVLNIRLGRKVEQTADLSNPTRYTVTGFKTKKPPLTAVIIGEEVLPEEVRKQLYEV